MSAKQSHLGDPVYGYDFVVATTQSSINSGLKSYFENLNQPEVAFCILRGKGGALGDIISLDEMKTRTDQVDPFAIANKSGDDYVKDSNITKLRHAKFYMGIKMRLGLPTGLSRLQKLDLNIIELGSSANNVVFNMYCAEFQIVQSVPPNEDDGDPGSWTTWSQPANTPWYFKTNVDLMYADLNSQLNIPYFNNNPEKKKNILDQLQVFKTGSIPFTLQQLLFDLDNISVHSLPEIAGITPADPAYAALERVWAYYRKTMQDNGSPVLSVHVVIPKADLSSFPLTSVERSVNRFLDSQNKVIDHPSILQQNCATLNYLCAINNNPPRPATEFQWNWLDENQIGDASGVISINRNTLGKYFGDLLLPKVSEYCFKASTNVDVDAWGNVLYYKDLAKGLTPAIRIPGDEGALVTFDTGNAGWSADDIKSSGASKAAFWIHPSTKVNVSAQDNKITIKRHLTIWVYVKWDNTEVHEFIVDRTYSDVYTFHIDEKGQLVSPDVVTTLDEKKDKDLKLDFWSKAFSDLEDITDWVNDYVKDVAAKHYVSVPVSSIQSLIFPGGDTFDYKNVYFSDNSDLVTEITYRKPH